MRELPRASEQREAPAGRPRPGPERRSTAGSLVASFSFAITGVVEAAGRDRNMRIHLAAGVLASSFAALADLTAAERGLVLLSVALVVSAEAANSAMEALVDLVCPHLDPRARVAKDAAAGAVLAVACGAVAVFLSVAGRAGPLALARALPLQGAAAVGAAVATGLLAAGGRRPWVDAALALGAAAGLAAIAAQAANPSALGAAALLLAVAAASARRRRAAGSVE